MEIYYKIVLINLVLFVVSRCSAKYLEDKLSPTETLFIGNTLGYWMAGTTAITLLAVILFIIKFSPACSL